MRRTKETIPISTPTPARADVPGMLLTAEIRQYHRETAERIWPQGATMRCLKCGLVEEASVADLAAYLGNGWPACCGESMLVGDARAWEEELAASG